MNSHIVHVGLYKTGSTWLQRHVFPSVEGATFAGGPVFDVLLKNLVTGEKFYESAFKAAVDELDARVLFSFEKLAAGRPWPVDDDHDQGHKPEQIADRLAQVVPNAQIVLFTRDREELVRSLYAQYVHEGGYVSQSSFEESVLAGHYLDMNLTIERFRRRFDRVLVLQYEHLRADPRGCVSCIEDFARVKLALPAQHTKANVSLSGWRLAVLRKWNRVFRASYLNHDPPLPIPYAGALRVVLQGRPSARVGH